MQKNNIKVNDEITVVHNHINGHLRGLRGVVCTVLPDAHTYDIEALIMGPYGPFKICLFFAEFINNTRPEEIGENLED